MSGIEISPLDDLHSLMTSNMDQFAQFRVKFNKLEDAEDKYGKLINFRAALEQEKVLSVGLALECDSALGTDDMARLCFCDKSSEEKYEMAMEAIHLGLAAIIASMAAAVAALIYYAIQHFGGGGGGGSSGSGGGGGGGADFNQALVKHKQEMVQLAAKEAASVDSEVIKELNDALQQSKNFSAQRKTEQQRQQQKLAKYGKSNLAQESDIPDHANYVRPLSALEADHLSTGEYTRAMMDLLKAVDESAPIQVLEDARHAYRELVKAGESEMEKPATADHVSALKQHYMQLMARPRRVHAALMEKLHLIEKKQQELESGGAKFPQGINQALRTFSEAVSSPEIGRYAKDRPETVRELEYMREDAQKAQKLFANESKQEHTAGKGNFSMDLSRHSRELLKELHGLLAVMLKVDMIFKRYWKSLDSSAKYLHHVVSTVRWNTALKLQDKGMGRQAIASDQSIRQLDNIMIALDNFRKRAA